MNKKALGIIVASALATVSFNTQASDINYNYADLTYINVDIGGGSSGNGLGLAGSYGITDNLNLVANYDSATINGNTGTEINFGLGYHQPINDTTDWYAEARYRNYDPGGGTTGSGYLGMLGVRMAASNQFQVRAGVGYGSLSGGGTTQSGGIFDVGGTYNINDQFGITADYYSDKDSSGATIIKLGARMNF
jgi:hypothetical protein